MAYTNRAIGDLFRLAEFLRNDPAAASATTSLVSSGLSILADHPLIGRTTEPPWHELIISRGKTGYVALYQYDPSADLVMVHGIRHQREVGIDD